MAWIESRARTVGRRRLMRQQRTGRSSRGAAAASAPRIGTTIGSGDSSPRRAAPAMAPTPATNPRPRPSSPKPCPSRSAHPRRYGGRDPARATRASGTCRLWRSPRTRGSAAGTDRGSRRKARVSASTSARATRRRKRAEEERIMTTRRTRSYNAGRNWPRKRSSPSSSRRLRFRPRRVGEADRPIAPAADRDVPPCPPRRRQAPSSPFSWPS
mmetsp:Transcript_26348/g.77906  ORF Transcript_26348/g.77906 Transcript_26348/m.77906 type:complete len:213 (+) Transcript_26348:915-1553(+)